MSIEGYARRLVWLWRDEPETFAKLGKAAVAIVAVAAAWKVGGWVFNAPKPKERRGDPTEKHRRRILGEATTSKTGLVLPSFALKAALSRAARLGSLSGYLRPLSAGETSVRPEGEIPFLVTTLDAATYKQKQGGRSGSGSGLRDLWQATGFPYLLARAKLALREPSSRPIDKARAVAAVALSPLAALSRLVNRTAGLIGGMVPSSSTVPANDAFAPPLPIEGFVCHLSQSHTLVLNRFYVFEQHGVIIRSDRFAPQTEALDEDDLHALWRCVAGINGLGFFNCGPESGSSQPRKHTQFVPFDSIRASKAGEALAASFLAAAEDNKGSASSSSSSSSGASPALFTPLDVAVRQHQKDHHFRFASSGNLAGLGGAAAGSDSGGGLSSVRRPTSGLHAGDVFTLPAFKGLRHAATMLGGDVRNQKAEMAAKTLHGLYHKALLHAAAANAAGTTGEGSGECPRLPHNLILTPTYLLVVLRSSDTWGDVPVNALAYCGFLLAKSKQAKEAIEQRGPLELLRQCGVRKCC